MRHSHTQNSSSLLFLVGSLVLTFTLASAKSFASEASGTGGNNRGPFAGGINLGAFKQADAKYKAKYAKAFSRASKAAYDKLTAEEKKLYEDIILTTEGEYGVDINKTQLVGFISFIKENPNATCSVSANSRENQKVKYTVFTDPKDKKKFGKGPNGGGASLILSFFSGGSSDRGGEGPKESAAGLLCTAGEKKMFFTGLPARPLNDYYNKNIQLKGEAVPTTMAETKPASTPTPVPVPASSTTNVTGYMTQSNEELKSEQEQTAFDSPAAAPEPETASTLGFSKPAK